jgi:hypothetical protein
VRLLGLGALVLAIALSCARPQVMNLAPVESDPIRLAWLEAAVRLDAVVARGDKIIEEIANWDVAMGYFRTFWDDRDAVLHALDEAARLDTGLSEDEKRLFLAEYHGATEQLSTIVLLNDPAGSLSAELVRVETLPGGNTAQQTRVLAERWRTRADNARRILRGFLAKRGIGDGDVTRHRAANYGKAPSESNQVGAHSN